MTAVRVHHWGPADWAVYRALRLRALADAPEAFGTTVDEAEGLIEAQWRERLAGRVTFALFAGSQAIGLASGITSDRPGAAELISMWLDPQWRGRGLADRLVEAVLRWALAEGYSSVRLWVAVGNGRAGRLYSRLGFRRTGELQPMAHGRLARMEFEMVHQLSDRPTPTSRPGEEDAQ